MEATAVQEDPLFVDLRILSTVPSVTTTHVPLLYASPLGASEPGIEVVVDHVAALSVLI